MIWHWKSTRATFQSRPTVACCLIVHYVPEHSRGNSPFSWEVLSVMIWHRAPGTTARVLLPHAWWSRPCLRIWSLALPCRRCPSLHPGRFFPVALIFGRCVITLKKKERNKMQDRQVPKYHKLEKYSSLVMRLHAFVHTAMKKSNAEWRRTTTRVCLYINFTIINLEYFSESCGLCRDRDNREQFHSGRGWKIKSIKVHSEGFHITPR